MKKTQAIKERLNAHRDLLAKLEALKLELQYAEDQYSATKSPNYSGTTGGGSDSKRTSEPEGKTIRKITLENRVRAKQAEIARDWAELEPLVEQLKPIETLILNLRYQYGEEWDEVCRAIYGRRADYELELDRYMNRIFKAHGHALLELSVMTDTE